MKLKISLLYLINLFSPRLVNVVSDIKEPLALTAISTLPYQGQDELEYTVHVRDGGLSQQRVGQPDQLFAATWLARDGEAKRLGVQTVPRAEA